METVGFLLSPLILSLLFKKLFFSLFVTQIWTISHFYLPNIFILPETKEEQRWGPKIPFPQPIQTSPSLPGLRVLGADIPSRTCHTQQVATPDCAKGLPGHLLVLVLVPIVLIVVGTDEEE